MLNPFSLYSFFANALFYETWSLVAGAAVGVAIIFAIKWPRDFKGLSLCAVLLLFSPIIGTDVKLLHINSFEIAMNVFLFGLLLTIIALFFLGRLTEKPRSVVDSEMGRGAHGS